MALIKCPECGETISDKAIKCIHCGYVLRKDYPTMCPECGAELEKGSLLCPECGCPLSELKQEDDSSAPQAVELTSVNIKPKNKKRFAIILSAIIVGIIVLILGIKKYQDKKAQEEALRLQEEQERIEAEEEQRRLEEERSIAEEAARIDAEYYSNLVKAYNLMVTGYNSALESGELIRLVWYNSVYEKSNAKTNPYTQYGFGRYYGFQTAIKNLFADTTFSTKIGSLEINQSSVATAMKEMVNPPDQWNEAYSKLQTLYSAYLKLTNLVISPSGNLVTYTEDFNNACNDTNNAFDEVSIYIE